MPLDNSPQSHLSLRFFLKKKNREKNRKKILFKNFGNNLNGFFDLYDLQRFGFLENNGKKSSVSNFGSNQFFILLENLV